MLLLGYTQPPLSDEGTGAHIFQLSIFTLLPTGILFLATADWAQPVRIVRRLAFSAVVVVLAFTALYYLEHYFTLDTIDKPWVWMLCAIPTALCEEDSSEVKTSLEGGLFDEALLLEELTRTTLWRVPQKPGLYGISSLLHWETSRRRMSWIRTKLESNPHETNPV